jgi:hypothetical protein
MTVMPMTITKAVPFVMAVFLLLSPSLLAAQVPTFGAGKPDSAVLQASVTAEANESAEIAQKLTNPLAAMISVPIQNWFDFNLGPRKDGFRYTMEAQPVYPVQISKDWNLLSRTTIPVVYQQKRLWSNDPSWLERFHGKPFSFSGPSPIHHLGSRSHLPDTDRHQWSAQHAQVRYRADRCSSQA